MALAASSLLTTAGAGAEPRARANSRLGADAAAARGRDVPGLAVNPTNPQHVVAADNDLLNGQCDHHVSFDGGATWATGHLRAPAAFPSPPCQPNPFDSGGYAHSNGSIAFGTGQNVYTTFSAKVGPPQRPENDIVAGPGDSILVARSTDGGRTFGVGVVVASGAPSGQPYYIRPKLTVVPRPEGDQVYVGFWGVEIPQVPGHGGAQGGLGLRQALMSVSNDSGATWSPVRLASAPVDASRPLGEQLRETSTPVAAAAGNAWFAWRNRDSATAVAPPVVNSVVVGRTTDGGATWTRVSPAPVSGGGGHPELARDPSNGNLYIAYQNLTTYPNPTNPATTANDLDIFVQRSTDNGVTWSAPLRVNDDPIGGQLQGGGIQQTQPFITVASNGRVDVVWHDRRNGYPANPLVSAGIAHSSATRRASDVYLASSTNGGVSFSPNRRITDRTMNLDIGLEGEVGGSTWYGPGSAVAGNDLVVTMPDSREGNYDNENNDVYVTQVDMGASGPAPVRRLGQPSLGAASTELSRLAYPGGLEVQGITPVTQVVVVNEGDVAGALAGAVLARDAWGPLLPSPAGGLPAGVGAEVSRLQAVGAFVIGGTGSLSAGVVSDLAAAGVPAASVRRLAGGSAAETARAVADVLDTRTAAQKTALAPAFPAVVVVNPSSPEAAAAVGLAAARRLPILFVERDSVPAATAAALAKSATGLAIEKTFVVGGPGAVSDAVASALPGVTRLGGADVVAVSEAVVAESRAQSVPVNVVYVADANRPVDTAVVGAAAARLGGPVLLSVGAAASGFQASLGRLGLSSLVDRVVVQLPLGGFGYRMVASDGGIFSFGNLGFHGSTGGTVLNAPVVGMANTPTKQGYWNVASDGGIFAFGDATFRGSTGGVPLNRPVVGMAPTRSGNGYWLVASDGGIFAFGDAVFRGSTGGVPLTQPIVGMAATPSGNGYWLVASDGGIFAFGDAVFRGSTGGVPLTQPVVGMAASPSGNGYWLVASDGGIFAFGDAAFFGSTGGVPLNRPIVGMAASPSGNGYELIASDGGIFAFGDAGFFGSTGGIPLFRPIVGISA